MNAQVMKAIVIHPTDRTTHMLCCLYDGIEDILLIRDYVPNSQMKHTLNSLPKNVPLYLLGHGSDQGLFWRQDDTQPLFDGTIVDHRHRFYLQKWDTIIAIFCYAELWMKAQGLHGLCTSMVISSLEECQEYGITSTQEEIDTEFVKMFGLLRDLIDKRTPLHVIPQIMKSHNPGGSLLNDFNYNSFRYV